MPTPAKVLGDVAGAPDMLPYAEDVYRYFRMLAAASPRVKVFTIGKTEEGREMIAVAIADEDLLTNAEGEQRAPGAARRSAHHRHGRREGRDADRRSRTPVYYITGTIHSAGDRRAHRADGAGLSPGGRRRARTSSTSART